MPPLVARGPIRAGLLVVCLLLVGCSTSPAVPTPTAPAVIASPAAAGAQSGNRSAVLPAPSATASASAPLGSSVQKIESAVSEGRIDRDTGMVHLLYAAYDPQSLPAEFQSSVPSPAIEGTAILTSLRANFSTLSPELKAKVQPFLKRPTDPQSFWYKYLNVPDDLAGTAATPSPGTSGADFKYVDAAKTNMRVWYLVKGGAQSQAVAQKLATEADQSQMWQKEKQVMLGHEPCSDAALEDNGGDGRLDVYLLPRRSLSPRQYEGGQDIEFNSAGLTVPAGEGDGCPLIGFLLINRSQSFDQMRSTLAHELFHAFQFSFVMGVHTRSQGTYGWWAESSATWAEDYVYPDLNTEWVWLQPGGWANKDGPTGPLDDFDYGGYQQYGAYIWPFYLTRRPGGDPLLVGRLWKAGEEITPIEAMSQMPDWAASFKEFALWNWNKPSAQKYDDDGKVIAPLAQRSVPITASLAAGEAPADIELPPLSMRYYSVTIDNAPGDVRQLRLDLGDIGGQTGAGVQAVVAVGDAANPSRLYNDDWSALKDKTFCRDNAQEAVSKLIVVVSNSRLDTDLTGKIVVQASSEPCQANGTATAVATQASTPTGKPAPLTTVLPIVGPRATP